MLTTQELGFILFEFIICNSFTWLIGYDLELKEKIIIPNIIAIIILGLVISLKMMGVDK